MIAALVEQVTVMISGNSNVIVYHKVIVMTAVSRNDGYYLALL